MPSSGSNGSASCATPPRHLEALDVARRYDSALLGQIADARGVLDLDVAGALRGALDDYYGSAESVARQMIRGDAGDDLRREQQAMQTKQARVDARIAQAGRFDDVGLAAEFGSVVAAQADGARVRLAISLTSLGLVLALSLWITRGLPRAIPQPRRTRDRHPAVRRRQFDVAIEAQTRTGPACSRGRRRAQVILQRCRRRVPANSSAASTRCGRSRARRTRATLFDPGQ